MTQLLIYHFNSSRYEELAITPLVMIVFTKQKPVQCVKTIHSNINASSCVSMAESECS